MTQLIPIRLDDDTIIYLEATENVQSPSLETAEAEEKPVSGRGSSLPSTSGQRILQNFQAIESTIRAYTQYTLRAFRDLAIANVDEVSLQFGIEIGGEAGIPYITRGQAKSNLNITVKCSFPKSN
jgi:hypothetical protein